MGLRACTFVSAAGLTLAVASTSYAEDDWGTNVFLAGTDAAGHYASYYYTETDNSVGAFSEVSQNLTMSGDVSTITTVMTLGSRAELRQVVSYVAGSHTFKRHWELENTSGGTLARSTKRWLAR
jgi:hypothetical protein